MVQLSKCIFFSMFVTLIVETLLSLCLCTREQTALGLAQATFTFHRGHCNSVAMQGMDSTERQCSRWCVHKG